MGANIIAKAARPQAIGFNINALVVLWSTRTIGRME